MNTFTISSNLINLHTRDIYPAEILVENGIIKKITRVKESFESFILPGFIDAHVHIESSMLVPSEFARLASIHGTVAVVSDPHEIANVLGKEGVRYMLKSGKKVPFHFYFGVPSCVPATTYETAGASLTPSDIRELFEKDNLLYLSEMMNYPGVLFKDPEVLKKIEIAKSFSKPVDGHAPGLTGEDAEKYISAGITTDHECYSLEEAECKIQLGMKVLIREGSAAKNFNELHPLIKKYPSRVMFCSDDKHPNDLASGHINDIILRSLSMGYDLFDVLTIACLNPVIHYNLDIGLLKEGDNADFILVNNPAEMKILKTYIKGNLVSENGKTLIESVENEIINNFKCNKKKPEDFEISAGSRKAPFNIRVIEALEGQLITKELHVPARIVDKKIVTDIYNDILKLTVVDRYSNSKPSTAFIKNFGLRKGAIASSVGHDSHNIISVGVSDEDICNAVNAVIENKGGISVHFDGNTEILKLPIAGIITNEGGYSVAQKYTELDFLVKKLGSTLNAPFMTLSFMALLVIPQLKLSDKGLFDGNKFNFVNIYPEEDS